MSSISRTGNAQMKARSRGMKPKEELEELEDIGACVLWPKGIGVPKIERVPVSLRQVKNPMLGTITWLGSNQLNLDTGYSNETLLFNELGLHSDLRREASALSRKVNGLLAYDAIPLDQRRNELTVNGVDYTVAVVAPGLVCMDVVQNGRSLNNVFVQPFELMAPTLPDAVVAAYDALTRQIAKVLKPV